MKEITRRAVEKVANGEPDGERLTLWLATKEEGKGNPPLTTREYGLMVEAYRMGYYAALDLLLGDDE
jgi:predicted DNA binding protein